MKKFLMILTIVLMPITASANCWQIKDNDTQKLCLARSKNNYNYCWQIKNPDTKNECLAIVKHDKNYCWQIKQNDKKQSCLAIF